MHQLSHMLNHQWSSGALGALQTDHYMLPKLGVLWKLKVKIYEIVGQQICTTHRTLINSTEKM
jgi:hypothetical protein